MHNYSYFLLEAGLKAPELIAVTGKGGVGKSTLAAGIAQLKAQQGLKTLLVEFGDYSYFENIYGGEVRFQPRELAPNLHISRWDGEGCLREFISHYIRIKKVVDLFFNNKVMKSLIKAAPALKELALLGKLTSVHRKFGPQMKYDVIVVDTFATGHFLSLLRVPRGMSEAIPVGPMGDQSRKIDQAIKDFLKVYIVTLAEDMPLKESVELSVILQKEFGLTSKFICNQWLKTDLTVEACKQVSGEVENSSRYLESLSNRIEQQGVAKSFLGSCSWEKAFWVDKSDALKTIESIVEQKNLKGFIV